MSSGRGRHMVFAHITIIKIRQLMWPTLIIPIWFFYHTNGLFSKVIFLYMFNFFFSFSFEYGCRLCNHLCKLYNHLEQGMELYWAYMVIKWTLLNLIPHYKQKLRIILWVQPIYQPTTHLTSKVHIAGFNISTGLKPMGHTQW